MKKPLVLYLAALLLLTCNESSETPDPPTPPEEQEVLYDNGDPNFLERRREIRERNQTNPFRQEKPWEWDAYHLAYRLNRANQRAARPAPPQGVSAVEETFANGKLAGFWAERGAQNQAGRVMSVTYEPSLNELFAGTAGGMIWRANMDNLEWECLNDHFKISNLQAVRVVKIDTNWYRLYAASSQPYFYYSDDFGLHWDTATGMRHDRSKVLRAGFLEVSSEAPFLMSKEPKPGTNTGLGISIYRSNDFGESLKRLAWIDTARIGDPANCELATLHGAIGGAWLAAGDSLYRVARFRGELAVRRVGKLPERVSGETRLAGRMVNNTATIYLLSNKKVYKTTNAGKDWTAFADCPTGPFGWYSFQCLREAKDTLFVGGTYLQRFDGPAIGWSKQTGGSGCGSWHSNIEGCLHPDYPGIFSVATESGPEQLMFCTDGGLYSSTDYAASVSNLAVPFLNCGQYYTGLTCAIDPNVVLAGAQDQGVQRASNATQPWDAALDFEQVVCCDAGSFSSADGVQMWASWTAGKAARFWEDITAGNGVSSARTSLGGITPHFLPPISARPGSPTQALTVGATMVNGKPQDSYVLELDYVQGTGIVLNHDSAFDFKASSGKILSYVCESPHQPGLRYAVSTNGHFFATQPGMPQAWSTVATNGPGEHYLTGAYILPSIVQPGLVYVAGSYKNGASVFTGTATSSNLTPMHNGLPNTMVYCIAATADEEYIFAATDLGPFVYVAADGMWYDMTGSYIPDQTFRWVEYLEDSQTVRFYTYGRGIWDFKISTLQKAVS